MNCDSINNVTHQGRDYEKKKKQDRKKSILYLIESYLRTEGYTDAASALAEEACLDTCSHVVCDNIDLDTILIEYENYYYLRYQKQPTISKSLNVAKTADVYRQKTVKRNGKTASKKTLATASQPRSFDNQPLETNFITVTSFNGNNLTCDGTLEREYSSPVVDLSHWKDEWKAYAEIISKKTNGYSGSDIRLVCKETAMQAMRSAFEVLENKSNKHLNFTITTADVFDSISKTKPSTSDADNNKYKAWQSRYASR